MYLETERLILREFVKEDIKDAKEYLSNHNVMKYIETPFNSEETKQFIYNFGMCKSPLVYALVKKDENKFIGHIIFHKFDELETYEIGWIIGESYWGNGYCFEISKEIIKYAFKTLNLKKVVAETVSENEESIKLIKRLGMIKENKNNRLLIFSLYNKS